MRKKLLGALEAPTLQAAAVPGIPDVYLSSASLGEIPSLFKSGTQFDKPVLNPACSLAILGQIT